MWKRHLTIDSPDNAGNIFTRFVINWSCEFIGLVVDNLETRHCSGWQIEECVGLVFSGSYSTMNLLSQVRRLSRGTINLKQVTIAVMVSILVQVQNCMKIVTRLFLRH